MIEIANAISVIKDPFNSASMTDFDIFCTKDTYFDRGWTYRGKIEFENGDTKGEQKFKAESLQALLIKMEAFVEELK